MGIIQRQGFKGMIGTYIGFVLGYINLLVIYPYFLSSADIGLMRVFIDLGIVLGSLAMLGADSSIYRFSPVFRERDPDRFKGLIPFFLLKTLIGSALVCLIFYWNKEVFLTVFGKNLPEILPLFIWIIPLVFLNAVNNLLEKSAAIKGRITVPVFIREVMLRLGYAALVLLYAQGYMRFEVMLKFIPLLFAVQLLILIFYVRHLKMSFSPGFGFFLKDKALRSEFIKYSLFLITGVLAGVFISKIDIFMLGSMKGASTTGIYTIAYYVGIVVSIPKRSMLQIANPIVSELTRKKDRPGLIQIYKDSSINLLVIAMLIFLVIWINLDSMYAIMPNGDTYKSGEYVVFIIAMSFIFQLAAGLGGAIMSYSQYYVYALWYALLSIVIAIVSNLVLIPQFGMNGAAAGTLITSLVLLISIVGINYWKAKLFPFDKKTLWSLLLFGLILLADQLIQPPGNIHLINTLKSAGLISLFVWLAYKLKLSSQLNSLADKALEYVKHRIIRPSGRR